MPIDGIKSKKEATPGDFTKALDRALCQQLTDDAWQVPPG